MVLDHLLPLEWITFLKRESLGVDAVGENHGRVHVGDRAEHVGAQDDPVVHRDRLVPGDPHPARASVRVVPSAVWLIHALLALDRRPARPRYHVGSGFDF